MDLCYDADNVYVETVYVVFFKRPYGNGGTKNKIP